MDAQARLAHAGVEAHSRAGARLPLQAGGGAVQPGARPRGAGQPGRPGTGRGRLLEERMAAHIERREAQTGARNPMFTQLGWHGTGDKPFASSEEAYRKLHIGSRKQRNACRLILPRRTRKSPRNDRLQESDPLRPRAICASRRTPSTPAIWRGRGVGADDGQRPEDRHRPRHYEGRSGFPARPTTRAGWVTATSASCAVWEAR